MSWASAHENFPQHKVFIEIVRVIRFAKSLRDTGFERLLHGARPITDRIASTQLRDVLLGQFLTFTRLIDALDLDNLMCRRVGGQDQLIHLRSRRGTRIVVFRT
jgi:hypothetical protein